MAPNDNFHSTADAIIANGWTSFVSGILFERFRTATDKGELRTQVSRDVALLDKVGIPRTHLAPALKDRLEAAIRCSVPVGG